MEVTKITERRKWAPQDILMGLGGTLSLFLGISFVAALEYAELLVRLIAAVSNSLFKALKQNRNEVKSTY